MCICTYIQILYFFNCVIFSNTYFCIFNKYFWNMMLDWLAGRSQLCRWGAVKKERIKLEEANSSLVTMGYSLCFSKYWKPLNTNAECILFDAVEVYLYTKIESVFLNVDNWACTVCNGAPQLSVYCGIYSIDE